MSPALDVAFVDPVGVGYHLIKLTVVLPVVVTVVIGSASHAIGS